MEISQQLVDNITAGTFDHMSIRESTHKNCNEIDYITEPMTYEEFFQNYLLPNRPCVLGPWATKEWRSRKEWVCNEGTPNLNLLEEKFGNATVPVANCGQEQYSSHPKSEMTLQEYITYIKEVSHIEGSDKLQAECLYLKDWHFVRAFSDYEAYTTPVFFCSDWLNEYWEAKNMKTEAEDQCKDDYRFVYFGPKGSWTPFHADVFRSYSWSANICGQKLWWLYPPGEEEHLKDRFGQLAFDLRSSELEEPYKFPKYKTSLRRLEVKQKAGEVLFVPTRWHHQVFNLEDTISINHNWLNGCNIDLCWKFLQESLDEVKREIQDCRDMEGWNQQCQLILKASSGIDYTEFYQFVYMIGNKRLEILHKHDKSSQDMSRSNSAFEKENYYSVMDTNHALFDLVMVKLVLKKMLSDEDFVQLEITDIQKPSEFLKTVESVLDMGVN